MSLGVVNLLLLLSALLSALSGVGGNAHVAAAPQVASRAVAVAATAATRAAVDPSRPVQAMPTLRAIAPAFAARPILALAPSADLLTNRRRE